MFAVCRDAWSSQDEEGGGDMNASSASGRGWGGLKELSKFELDRLERARRLRQERLETGTIQVWRGLGRVGGGRCGYIMRQLSR